MIETVDDRSVTKKVSISKRRSSATPKKSKGKQPLIAEIQGKSSISVSKKVENADGDRFLGSNNSSSRLKPSSSITKKVSISKSSSSVNKKVSISKPSSSVTKKVTISNSKFMCDICVDEKPMDVKFKIMGCNHYYCKQCIAKYVGSKLQENVSRISCPVTGCNGLLEPDYCRSILPDQVFNRWGDVLCEGMLLGFKKFYCPFKDCSAVLIDDECNLVITQSECPECRRLFCAKCKVGWHSDIVCEEFQKLHKDERRREDMQLMQLAKNKKWQRCPSCRIYVARTKGCAQMKCRCGCTFCYKCGGKSVDHYCQRCGT